MLNRAKMIAIVILAGALSVFMVKPAPGNGEEPNVDILRDMREIEFGQIDYDKPADPYFAYIKGTIPILVSAPHGAKHFRTKEHRWKVEDAYTASLAIELGKLTGAHVLYVKNKAGEDPNNDEGTQYKEFLKKVVKESGIRFILDLHGSESGRPYKVDVGIMNNAAILCSCPTYRDLIQEAFSGFEPRVFNQNFSAHGKGTITYFANKTLGIEAAQIEINANYRIVESKTTGFKADPKKVLQVVRRLVKLIRAVDESIREEGSEKNGPTTLP
jgi:hypothetical protein